MSPRDLDLNWDDDAPVAPVASERGGARQRMGNAVNDALTDEYLADLLQQAKEATTGVKAVCRECGAEQTVRFPDFKKILDSFTAALEQAEGRPELRGPDAVQVIIERPAL